MNPDLKSGRGFRDYTILTLTRSRKCPNWKTPIRPFCATIQESRRETVQTENLIPSQDLQRNTSHDTKLAVERELTNGNLAPPSRKSVRRPFSLKRNKPRSCLDPESGQAISNLPDPHAESCRYFAPGKMLDRSILRPEPEDSRISVPTGGTPSEKNLKSSCSSRHRVGVWKGCLNVVFDTLAHFRSMELAFLFLRRTNRFSSRLDQGPRASSRGGWHWLHRR